VIRSAVCSLPGRRSTRRSVTVSRASIPRSSSPAAFWLMHGVRAAQASPLAKCEFATLLKRLIKIGARVIEHVARIHVQLPTSCPHAALFRGVALGLMPSGP
jgi:hypothetical protein